MALVAQAISPEIWVSVVTALWMRRPSQAQRSRLDHAFPDLPVMVPGTQAEWQTPHCRASPRTCSHGRRPGMMVAP